MTSQTKGGPVTRSGKNRSRRNALRHGLSASVLKTKDRKTLQRRIKQYSDGSPDPVLRRLARDAAEARVFLDKVEQEKAKKFDTVMNEVMSQQDTGDLSLSVADGYSSIANFLQNLSRYERAAQAKWRKAVSAIEKYRLEMGCG